MHRALLVARQDRADLLRVVERVEDRQRDAARDSRRATSTPSASRQRTSASAPVMRSRHDEHRPLVRADETSLRVAGEDAGRDLRRRRRPRRARAASSSSATSSVSVAGVDVDGDRVALVDERDRTARGRLGRHVADRRALGGAGEAAVGDERDAVRQSPCPRSPRSA